MVQNYKVFLIAMVLFSGAFGCRSKSQDPIKPRPLESVFRENATCAEILKARVSSFNLDFEIPAGYPHLSKLEDLRQSISNAPFESTIFGVKKKISESATPDDLLSLSVTHTAKTSSGWINYAVLLSVERIEGLEGKDEQLTLNIHGHRFDRKPFKSEFFAQRFSVDSACRVAPVLLAFAETKRMAQGLESIVKIHLASQDREIELGQAVSCDWNVKLLEQDGVFLNAPDLSQAFDLLSQQPVHSKFYNLEGSGSILSSANTENKMNPFLKQQMPVNTMSYNYHQVLPTRDGSGQKASKDYELSKFSDFASLTDLKEKTQEWNVSQGIWDTLELPSFEDLARQKKLGCESILKERMRDFDFQLEFADSFDKLKEANRLNEKVNAANFGELIWKSDWIGTAMVRQAVTRSAKTSEGWIHQEVGLQPFFSPVEAASEQDKFTIDLTTIEVGEFPFFQKAMRERWRVNSSCQIILDDAAVQEAHHKNDQILMNVSSSTLDLEKAGAFRSLVDTLPIPDGFGILETLGLSLGALDIQKAALILQEKVKFPFVFLGFAGFSHDGVHTDLVDYGTLEVSDTKINESVSTPFAIDPIVMEQMGSAAPVGQKTSGVIWSDNQLVYRDGFEFWNGSDLAYFQHGPLQQKQWVTSEAIWQSLSWYDLRRLVIGSFDPPVEEPWRLWGWNLYQDEMLLASSEHLKYSNLGAYWVPSQPSTAQSEIAGFEVSQRYKAADWTMADYSHPLVQADGPKNGHPWLKGSEFVQPDLPELQPVIDRLEPYRATINRSQMAYKIAMVVYSLLPYDYSSLQSNKIHILSTKEILQRKTGVCQHHANLFAAIARRMGLPTKIIVGRRLPGYGHAWNEIELRPGVWVPVEPQSPVIGQYGGSLFERKAYLPFGVGNCLEHRRQNQEDAEVFRLMHRFRFLAKKMSPK
jgi:hypothetical protein